MTRERSVMINSGEGDVDILALSRVTRTTGPHWATLGTGQTDTCRSRALNDCTLSAGDGEP